MFDGMEFAVGVEGALLWASPQSTIGLAQLDVLEASDHSSARKALSPFFNAHVWGCVDVTSNQCQVRLIPASSGDGMIGTVAWTPESPERLVVCIWNGMLRDQLCDPAWEPILQRLGVSLRSAGDAVKR